MNRDSKEPFDFSKIKIGAGRVLGVMLLMDGEVRGSRVTYDGLAIEDYNRGDCYGEDTSMSRKDAATATLSG